MTNINKFQAMQMDITNCCNLRCTFCTNKWNEKTFMDDATFEKIISLLPLIERGFLSCHFEPTVHPSYIEFFKKVPKTKGYIFITTNLAKKFTDSEIEALSNLNLDSITVSVTSFKKDIYEKFHKGAEFDIFIDNLERLNFALKGKNLKLRFITLVFKENLDEIEDIIVMCNEKYGSVMNQFRTPFKQTLKDSIKNSVISENKWNTVREKLEKLPYNVKFFNPLYTKTTTEGKHKGLSTYFTIKSDGTVYFREHDKSKLPSEFRESFNISELDNPYEFFKGGLNKI